MQWGCHRGLGGLCRIGLLQLQQFEATERLPCAVAGAGSSCCCAATPLRLPRLLWTQPEGSGRGALSAGCTLAVHLLGQASGPRARQVCHAGRAGVAVVLHDAAPDAGQGAAAPARRFVRGQRQLCEAPESKPMLVVLSSCSQQLRGGLLLRAGLRAGGVARQLDAPHPGAWPACFRHQRHGMHQRVAHGGVRAPAR